MPSAADYVVVQHAVAQVLDAGKEVDLDDFKQAAREERAIALLDEKFGDTVDLTQITTQPETMTEMEKELSEAMHGNSPSEYGIAESGLAGYLVHLAELIELSELH